MLSSFRNVGAGRCIRSCAGIWAKCSASWRFRKTSKVEEGHQMPDPEHMLLSIPPKYAMSQVVGFIKGKSAIYMARVYGERKRNFVGQHFWARGFCEHGRARRGGDPRLHSQSREGRSEARANEPLALTAPPLGGSKLKGPRQRPFLPLRAAQILKTPALPGDTYPAERRASFDALSLLAMTIPSKLVML